MKILRGLNEEKLLFFDIETAPVVSELKLDTPLFDSWEYKVNKEGKLTNNEIIDSYFSAAGLYSEFAKIVSIVVGKIKGGKIYLATFDDENEIDLLNKFNAVLEKSTQDRLVGFANIGFDTPFVLKRMLINGVEPNEKLDTAHQKPWEKEEVDLSAIWKGTSFNRGSLLNIATAFGLPSPKDDISGADVGRVYYEGGLSRISEYCRKDVITTINVFKKMRLEEPLELVVGKPTIEKEPLLTKLFNGGVYGEDEKLKLITLLKTLDDSELVNAYEVLSAMTSTAKNKKTQFTKKHITELKKLIK